jgi:hypothetical protein
MNWQHKIIVLGITLTLVGCGFKPLKATSVDSEKLELPKFPAKDHGSFALAAGKTAHNFSGNFLIWSPTVSPEQIRQVLEASINTRRERAKTLDMVKQIWLPANSQRAMTKIRYQEVDQSYRAALTAGFRADKVRHDVTEPTARGWFAKRLTELTEDGATGDDWVRGHKGEIERSFQAYCDAKIWEFALSKMAVMNYKERPTPLGLCEEYYGSSDPVTGKKPYFQNLELCASSSSPEGKNYFACLWQDGLFKTPQFKYLEDNPNEICVRGAPPGSKAQSITSWATGSPSLIERILRDDVARPKLASAVMLASSIPASTPDSLGRLYPELKSCQLAFRRIDFDRTPLFEQSSPGRLIAIGETDGLSSQQYAFDLIPRRVPQDETKDALDYQRLTRLVRMFGWRVPTGGQYSVSVNDLMFNQPLGFDLSEEDPSRALQTNKDAIIPDNIEKADPAFRVFVAVKNEYVSAIENARTAIAVTLEDRERALRIADEALAFRATLDQELSVAGLRAVNALGALSYFRTFTLRLIREGTQLTASVTLEKPITACIDTETRTPCAGLSVGEGDIRNGALEFRQDANKLIFRIPLENLSEIGFAPAPRTAADLDKTQSEPLLAFNDIPQGDLVGHTLEIIMYGNLLGDLEFFSGDIFVLDSSSGAKLKIGSLNGDLFDETRRELMASPGT